MAANPNEGLFEREFRAADRDLAVTVAHLADDEPDVGLPQCRIVGFEFVPEHAPEAFDNLPYKLTVEIETPAGMRTGSVVRQVGWTKGMQLTQEADATTITRKGEAAIIDPPG